MEQQQQIPELTFDHPLLQVINETCLRPNETIQIHYHDHFEEEEEQEDTHYEGFLLSLLVDGKTASHIELMFGENDYMELSDMMIISSETQQGYRQRNYNTILRAVLVLLLPSMKIDGKKIKKVVSNAQNHLSVYSLAKLGFVVEGWEGFSQAFNLSFYTPFQQTNQEQRLIRQGRLKQYIKNRYENKEQEQELHEVSMVLRKKDYSKSVALAKVILKRVCGSNCLQQIKKRKYLQQQQQKKK